ncbi:MAG: hypothetical protein XXXJIFNMEKO3_LKCDNKCA_00070 (plasmid) [Candidatus Erwinia impunctatus]
MSPAQENLFILRWLAAALKQWRFSRDVTPEIEWLLKLGCQLGVGAKLAGRGGLSSNVARLRRERRCSAASGVCMFGAPLYTLLHAYPPSR